MRKLRVEGKPWEVDTATWHRALQRLPVQERKKLERLREQGLSACLWGHRLLLRLPQMAPDQAVHPDPDKPATRAMLAALRENEPYSPPRQAQSGAEAFAAARTDLQEGAVDYRLVKDEATLREVLGFLAEAPLLGVDTETTGLDPHGARIRLLQLAAPDQPVAVLDLFALKGCDLEQLADLLQGSSLKVLQNAKFDLKFLQRAGLALRGPIFDTMLAARILDSGRREGGFGLADLAGRYLDRELSKEEQASDWTGALNRSQLEYAATDSRILLDLHGVLRVKLQEADLVETARLEFSCAEAVAAMELAGMQVDTELWRQLGQEFAEAREAAAQRLQSLLQPGFTGGQATLFGEAPPLNLDSQPQVLEALQGLGIPVTSTARSHLLPLAQEYEAVGALMEYRRVAKAVQAFTASLLESVNPHTGRIHPDYQQMGAATGRFSCRNPNLQQVPRDPAFRQCFVAAPRHRLVVADYSQIELRIAAEISGDERMLEVYRQGQDLHRFTASLVKAKELSQVTGAERQSAKAINFGLIYAMGVQGLQSYARNTYGVSMSQEEAEVFHRRFFHAYSGIAAWHQKLRQEGARESRTLGGRRRQWPDKPRVTELYNTPVQGTAADIVKEALALLLPALAPLQARLIATVHDEIVVEAPAEIAGEAARIVEDTMIQAARKYLPRVPVEVEVELGENWAVKA